MVDGVERSALGGHAAIKSIRDSGNDQTVGSLTSKIPWHIGDVVPNHRSHYSFREDPMKAAYD